MPNRRRRWARFSLEPGQAGGRERRSPCKSRWDTPSKTWPLPGWSTERPWPKALEQPSSFSVPRRSALQRLSHRRQDPVERGQVIVLEGGRRKGNIVGRHPRHGRVQVVEELLHEGGRYLRPEPGREWRLVHDHAASRLRHLAAQRLHVEGHQVAQIQHRGRNAFLLEAVRCSKAELNCCAPRHERDVLPLAGDRCLSKRDGVGAVRHLRPASARPRDAPMMLASARGVSTTRAPPNRSTSPLVVRNTPPSLPTSRPSTITRGSRSISSLRALLIASTMLRSGIYCWLSSNWARCRRTRSGGS